ncbi:MAG: LysE family transporter [Bacteroidia bacterium]|nr:LysE family transporter [Bacteroidia bacterium]
MILAYFLFALATSFFGSMQPGPVNLSVLHSCLNKQYKKALNIAIGGSVPELIYSFLALVFAHKLNAYTVQLQAFASVVAILFIVVGGVIYFMKPKQRVSDAKESKSGFATGFLISIVNPQLILFWIGIIAAMNLQHFDLVNSGFYSQAAFSIGTGVGAFMLHYLLIVLVKKYSASRTVYLIKSYGNKMIGLMLILMGLVQLFIP